MKKYFKILLLTILTSLVHGQKEEQLYSIKNANLWGYMNGKGKVIIKPQFYRAGNFSEGLAAVRVDGSYGYINKKGVLIIEPKFDVAYGFSHGLAKVFVEDGKPYFIDKKGRILFQHDFASILDFGGCHFTIATDSLKNDYLIDRNGDFITERGFKKIFQFFDGVALIYGLNHNNYFKDTLHPKGIEVGLMDTLGNLIIPFGKYRNISEFVNGYAVADLIDSKDENSKSYLRSVIIDKKGNQQFTFNRGSMRFVSQGFGFQNGRAIVAIDIHEEKKARSGKWPYEYMGAVNIKGEIIINNKRWEKMTHFSNNRAFAKDSNNRWWLINKNGMQIGDSSFSKILYSSYDKPIHDLFADGLAFVRASRGWLLIDTMYL